MYWDEAGCDKLPFPVSYMVFDAAVNSGPSRADKWLQAALGVEQDGILGKKTLTALEEAVDREDFVIYYRIIDERLKFLVALIRKKPSQLAFLLGWMRRLNRVLLRSTIAAGEF
jgi:lysozyme family protein